MGKNWQKTFAILLILFLTYLAFFLLWKKLPEIPIRPQSLWQEKELLEEQLKKGTLNSGDLVRLAQIYEYLGEKKKAAKTLEQALVLAIGEDKSDDELYRLQREIARLLAEEGNYAAAEKILFALKKSYPQKAGAYNSQGQIFLKKKKSDLAKKEFETGKKVDRKDPESYQNLALLAEKKKNFKLAQKILEEAIKENPESGRTYLALADFYSRQGKKEKALSFYQKAYQKDGKKSSEIMEKYAEALEKAGRKDEALKIWDEILARDPKNAKALFAKARNTQEKEKALSLYKEALAWDPKNKEIAQEILNKENKILKEESPERKTLVSEKSTVHHNEKEMDADVHFNEGLEKFKKGNYPEALEKFNEALNQNPTNFQYRYWQAKTLEKLGKKEQAEEAYQKALQQEGTSQELYQIGRYFYQEKKYDLAEKAFHKATEKDPKFAKALYAQALSQEKQGKTNQAQDNYQKALVIDPNFEEARFNLAILLQEQGQYQRALRELQFLENQKNDADVYFQKGQVLQKLKDNKEALRAFEKAISIKPDFYEARFNLALLYSNLGEKEKAISLLKPMIEKNPTGELFYTLGKLEQERGQKEAALTYYEKAIQIDANFSQAYINASLLYADSGNLKQAENYLQKALLQKANQNTIRQNLAKVLLLQKKYQEAEEQYLWLIQNDKHDPEIFLGYGRLLEETGRYAEAAKSYQRALAKNSTDLRLLEKLAYLYYHHLNEKEEAKKLFQKILQLKPDHPQKKEIQTILATL